MSVRTSGYVREEFVAPADHSFTLPDESTVKTTESDGIITVVYGSMTVTFEPSNRTLLVTPHGIVNDDRQRSEKALAIKSTSALAFNDLWVALYAFWIRRSQLEVQPFIVTENADALVNTGLAINPPDAQSPSELLAYRSAFWQGAGAPAHLHWLKTPSHGSFPYIQSFTRSEHVLTTHPLRPPKPAPGTLFYSRFIHTVGQQLTFTHTDASNPAHFEAYSRWQNSDRVNVGWREKGPDEKHRAYLADRLADPHIMGFIVAWDGEFAGYGEMSWVKEDPMGTYVGGLGEYDQGTHLLIGEEKFRGRQRFTAVMTAMKHACFLRDPRTDVVVGEPRADLPIVPRLIAYLPQELNREFEFPHKRAVYFTLRRERFFQAAMLD